jgi:hypothetical protein
MERKHIARGRQLYTGNGKPNDQVFPIGNSNSMDSISNSVLNENQLQQLAKLQQLHQLQQKTIQEQSVIEQKVVFNKDSLDNFKYTSAESYHNQKQGGHDKMDYNNNYITNYLKNNSIVTKFYGTTPVTNTQTLSHLNYKHNQKQQQPHQKYAKPYQQYPRHQYKYVKEPEEEDGCKVCDRPDRNLFCKECSHNWKVS